MKGLILGLLLFIPQDNKLDMSPYLGHVTVETRYLVTIQGSGEELFSIRPDGTFHYGPHFKPDAAALAFINVISGYVKKQLPCKP